MFSLVEYEAVADAAPVDAGAAEPVDVAPEAPVDDTPVDATPDAPPDPLAGLDVDAIRALAEVAPSLLQMMNPAEPVAPQPQQTDSPPEYDPFDPQSVQAYNDWRDQQLLGQIRGMIDPLAQRAETEVVNEQQALLKDAAHDVETRKGEFIGDDDAKRYARDQMLQVARQVFPEVSQRYGMTDRAADMALERAYDTVKGWQDSIAKAAVEQHVNRNTRLADQHAEPGLGGGSGVQTTPTDQPYKPGQYAQQFGARANALRGA